MEWSYNDRLSEEQNAVRRKWLQDPDPAVQDAAVVVLTAVDKVIRQNSSMIRHYDDLLGIATLKFEQARKKWESKGKAFNSDEARRKALRKYTYKSVWHKVDKERWRLQIPDPVRIPDGVIRRQREEWKKVKKLKRRRKRAERLLKREVTDEEFIEHGKQRWRKFVKGAWWIQPSRFVKDLLRVNPVTLTFSLDGEIETEEGNVTIAERSLYPPDSGDEPAEEISEEYRHLLGDWINFMQEAAELTTIESEALVRAFQDFKGTKPNFAEIGRRIGVARQSAKRAYDRAIRKLKKLAETEKLPIEEWWFRGD